LSFGHQAAIRVFIESLATAFAAPGLAQRASNLFEQAKLRGIVRWGMKARLIAAGCLSVAFRESLRPDSFHELACVLDCSPRQICRARTLLLTTLGLQLVKGDPLSYISELEAILSKDIQHQPVLPLLSPLKGFNIREVSATARSLANLVARLSSPVSELPLKATTCAVFIVSLEGHARKSLPRSGDLAEYFGRACNLGRSIVQRRYEALQDEISNWLKELPWLDQHGPKKHNGRPKIAKRMVVARGLKDIIHWQDHLWKKHVLQNNRPTVDLEAEEGGDLVSDDEFSCDAKRKRAIPMETEAGEEQPSKKRKRTRVLSDATQFLLNPLSVPLPTIPEITSEPASCVVHVSSNSSSTSYLGVSSYMLAVESADLIYQKPTRLQLLSVSRGGVSEAEIDDEELFEDGEWETMQRAPEEIEYLRQLWGFNESETAPLGPTQESATYCREASSRTERSSKIDLEALAQFMGTDGVDDKDDDMIETDLQSLDYVALLNFDDGWDKESDTGHGDTTNNSALAYIDDGESVIIDDWRPASP
jgi:transcription factor IIIB 90 kDa subunit